MSSPSSLLQPSSQGTVSTKRFAASQDDPSQGDAQLVNSAYLDNDSMELYHGRLDKKPNAIALRLRWCADLTSARVMQSQTAVHTCCTVITPCTSFSIIWL